MENRILALLSENARMSLAEMAARLETTPEAVREASPYPQSAAYLPPERRDEPPAEASVLPPVTPLPVRNPVFLFP